MNEPAVAPNPSDRQDMILGCSMIIVPCVFFLIACGAAYKFYSDREALKKEAVKRGYGEYKVNENDLEWHWVEKVER